MSEFTSQTQPDGTQIIRAKHALTGYSSTVCSDLVTWAARRPLRTFLAERRSGEWFKIDYRTAFARMRAIGAELLRSPASAAAPLAIVAENGIDHALVALGAMYVGVPVAPFAPTVAAAGADLRLLRKLLGVLRPGLIFATDPAVATRLIAAAGGIAVATNLAFRSGEAAAADAAFAMVGAQTVAKILFPADGPGMPLGAIVTNGMLAANQSQLGAVWPELTDAPTLVDGLPWSDWNGATVFGMVLRNGGTLYIDDGRPAPHAFAASVRNLRDIAPTFYFNLPGAFALLHGAMLDDEMLTRGFFSRLRGFGSVAGPFSEAVRDEFVRLSRGYAPHDVRMMSAWGLTETATLTTTASGGTHADTETAGVPVPGIDLAFVPSGNSSEIRVRGPNVTPGYWGDRAATRDAFDANGFFRTRMTGTLKDAADPARGILITGRSADIAPLAAGG